MRAARSSLLVAVVTLVAACSSVSSGPVDLAMTEPPPVTAPADVAEPAAAQAVVETPAVVPVAPEAVAVLPAPAPDEVAAANDDPIPLGAAPRGAAAPRPGASTGSVRAAHAAPARKAQPTGRIEIPAIGLNHLTYEGIDLPTIDNGPSHWPGTPMPGETGNTVFPGHRTTHSRPFFDLDKLRPGDEVIFSNPTGRFTYRVRQTMIVDANATWVVNNTPDATFTILACHPKGSAKQRIVVKGNLVGPPKAGAAQPAQPNPNTTPTTKRKFLGILGG